MRLVILFAAVLLAGCKNMQPLKIDPCAVEQDGQCYAVPINQPGKPEYLRPINFNPPDICITTAEYAATQKAYREILLRCGDNCK